MPLEGFVFQVAVIGAKDHGGVFRLRLEKPSQHIIHSVQCPTSRCRKSAVPSKVSDEALIEHQMILGSQICQPPPCFAGWDRLQVGVEALARDFVGYVPIDSTTVSKILEITER
jgi:hypothetical protein